MSHDVVSYFKMLAFNVKMAILPLDEITVFADSPSQMTPTESINPLQLRSEIGNLHQLVNTQEQVVIEQSKRIESVLQEELLQQTEQLTKSSCLPLIGMHERPVYVCLKAVLRSVFSPQQAKMATQDSLYLLDSDLGQPNQCCRASPPLYRTQANN